mmetsp:Transcript_42709/g.91165  ORF Transcript_42709/g.91165 Transcript_42709/m.91165 type:complete len:200 (+) Transcript_42709:647-1246(+)
MILRSTLDVSSPISALACSMARRRGGSMRHSSLRGGVAPPRRGPGSASTADRYWPACSPMALSDWKKRETIVIASTGVCSAFSPTRPFSKTMEVNDLSYQMSRPSPSSEAAPTSCLPTGDAVSSFRQKSASSTTRSEAMFVESSRNLARSAAHLSRFIEVSTLTGTCSSFSKRLLSACATTSLTSAWSVCRSCGLSSTP